MEIGNGLDSKTQKERRELGSTFAWLMARGGEVAIWATFGVVLLIISPVEGGLKYILIGYFVFVHLFFRRLVYGYADEKGIYYRRFFRLHFVPWANVQNVVWVPWRGIHVYKKGDFFLWQRLWFALPWNEKDIFQSFRERFRLNPPELVGWLQRKVRLRNLRGGK